jgi:hypothetical protein
LEENVLAVFFLGFIVDMSILDLFRVNIYAIVRINKRMILKQSPEKLVVFYTFSGYF